MKLGQKVALKEKRPELDHRCKGPFFRFCYGGAARFFCFECDSFKVVGKKEIRRVVPKTLWWVNFWTENGTVDFRPVSKKMAERCTQFESKAFTNEIAPVYLGRKRRVK